MAGPFVDELSMGWIEFGAGNMDRAVAVFEELATDQSLSELAWLHLGLARAAVGDFEAADEILSGERAGRISQTERVVRARAEILVQLGLRGDALDLLDGYTQRVPDPALLALSGPDRRGGGGALQLRDQLAGGHLGGVLHRSRRPWARTSTASCP